MNILITGADGFLGRHLTSALLKGGHQVTGCGRGIRRRDNIPWIYADFTKDHQIADWLPRITGFDVVINSVGILREHGTQTFDALHHLAPAALFAASAQAGVKKVIQISALGSDENATTHYHLSKRAGDETLMRQDMEWAILRPSLIYGDDGGSAQLYRLLASMPIIPLPGNGLQTLRPVHVDDITEAVIQLLQPSAPNRKIIEAVGGETLSQREYFLQLRRCMGLSKTFAIPTPRWLMRLAAKVGDYIPSAMLCSETLSMLVRHCPGDPAEITALLGRSPRQVKEFIEPEHAIPLSQQSRLGWSLPILRISIAAVWLVTAWISAFVYPEKESVALLAPLGITGDIAIFAVYCGAMLDAAIGLAVLILPPAAWLGWLQATIIFSYSLLIAWKLPQFLSHPFGPILKHLPMLAGIMVLTVMSDTRGRKTWTT